MKTKVSFSCRCPSSKHSANFKWIPKNMIPMLKMILMIKNIRISFPTYVVKGTIVHQSADHFNFYFQFAR